MSIMLLRQECTVNRAGLAVVNRFDSKCVDQFVRRGTRMTVKHDNLTSERMGSRRGSSPRHWRIRGDPSRSGAVDVKEEAHLGATWAKVRPTQERPG